MKYFNAEAVDWTFERTVGVSNDKLVLLAIARRANKHWASFPSKAEIARITGLSEASLPRSFKRLEDEGHMVRIAFAAGNRQEQKIGFVLAGCGRPLNALDADFLALAFASRKQSGTPMAVKPQHWSGERIREGRTTATPQGCTTATPGGGSAATPRRKEHTEDQKGQEEAFGRAGDESPASDQNLGAFARVAPAAPTREMDHPFEAETPAQRAPRERSLRQQRDDDWTVQIEAAPLDLLETAVDSYRDTREGVYEWALKVASGELGLDPTQEYEPDVEAQLLRRLYLFLLKKHAAYGDPAADELSWPLDDRIRAMPRPRPWDEKCSPPDGQSVEEFAVAMRRAVSLLTPAERGMQIAEIRKAKPGIWEQSRMRAKAYMKQSGKPVASEAMDNYAMQYAILHYEPKGEWPISVVPWSMRPAQTAENPPPWAA